MVTSDFRPEVEIRPFHACAMHPAIITGTVRSLLTWLWGRYHVPQNAFLVRHKLAVEEEKYGRDNAPLTNSSSDTYYPGYSISCLYSSILVPVKTDDQFHF